MRTHLKTAVSILALTFVLVTALPATAFAAPRTAPRPVPTQNRERGREVGPGPIERIIRAIRKISILDEPPIRVDDQPTIPHP